MTISNRRQERDNETGLTLVDGPEDVPAFATEDEEAAFWDTHTFSDRFWQQAQHVSLEQLLAEPHHGEDPPPPAGADR